MKTNLENALKTIDELNLKLAAIDTTLKQATPEQLNVFLKEVSEIEKRGNRLDNRNIETTQLISSINKSIMRFIENRSPLGER